MLLLLKGVDLVQDRNSKFLPLLEIRKKIQLGVIKSCLENPSESRGHQCRLESGQKNVFERRKNQKGTTNPMDHLPFVGEKDPTIQGLHRIRKLEEQKEHIVGEYRFHRVHFDSDDFQKKIERQYRLHHERNQTMRKPQDRGIQ